MAICHSKLVLSWHVSLDGCVQTVCVSVHVSVRVSVGEKDRNNLEYLSLTAAVFYGL